MSALGYIIVASAKVLGLIVNLYTLIIIAAVLISWINADPYNPLVRVIRQLTEPVFFRVRRIMPAPFRHARIDIAPLITLIILVIIETVLGGLLRDAARSLMTAA